jgi:beta-phosphoglucomutase
MMRLSNLERYLDMIVSNEDVSKAKPDPEMYQTAMARLGLAPNECLILEDNEHGIAAARASKGHVMVVSGVWDVVYEKIAQRIADIDARAEVIK